MAEPKSAVIVVFVALRSTRLPEPKQLLAALQYYCPDCPPASDLDQSEHSTLLRLGDSQVAISLMPAPIPWGDLEGPCATAWWWPEATEQMRGHTHHAIVALLGGSGTPVERHVLLSRVVAAVAANADAVGIYWGAGTVVHETQSFCQSVETLDAENLDPQLWVDMRLERQEDGSFRYFTTGMTAFDCLEVEIDEVRDEPMEILEFCYGIVSYVLGRGAAIPDRETVGRTPDEKIVVRHLPSMFDRGPAMKLQF